MAIDGKMLSEVTDKVSEIQGTERIYVSDGSGKPKYIEANQLIQAGGKVIVDSEMLDNSTNPVQNKVIKDYIDKKVCNNELIKETNEVII